MKIQFESHETANETVSKIVQVGFLPSDNEFLKNSHNDDGIFSAQESDMFDYKAEYPFSNSDDFFASILRLICALHNTYGGIIVFGVHDTERTAGKNKVIVDDEKINRKLRESLTRPLSVSCQKFCTPSGDVDVLLVPKRDETPPVRFNKNIGDYSAHSVFFRNGAEVLEAAGGGN